MQPRYLGKFEILAGTKSPAPPTYSGANPVMAAVRRRKFINLFLRVYGGGNETVMISAFAGHKEAGVLPVDSFGTNGTLTVAYTGTEIQRFITVEVHNHDLGLFVTGLAGANLAAGVNVEIKVTDSNNM